MPGTYEENMQVVLDLRQQVLDPNQDDPTPDEVWEAVNALHATRGVAAKKKAASKVVFTSMADMFGKKEEKADGGT